MEIRVGRWSDSVIFECCICLNCTTDKQYRLITKGIFGNRTYCYNCATITANIHNNIYNILYNIVNNKTTSILNNE